MKRMKKRKKKKMVLPGVRTRYGSGVMSHGSMLVCEDDGRVLDSGRTTVLYIFPLGFPLRSPFGGSFLHSEFMFASFLIPWYPSLFVT